jgi:hypothetical protein
MRFGRVLLVMAVVVVSAAGRVDAVPWSEAFAPVRDTVVFFDAGGLMLRAPFDLATRETLWAPAHGQELVRVRVSPDGRRVAWLTRAHDRDTTRLWVDGTGMGGPRMRYFALLPDQYGRVHSEPSVPTTEDRETRGARLVQAGAFMRRAPSNTLEWTPDSRAVVFGYDDGIAAVPVDGGEGFGVTRALAVELEALEPAPIYLVDAIVLRSQTNYFRPEGRAVHPSDFGTPLEDGRPIESALELAHPDVMLSRSAAPGTYLLYPLAHRWRVFSASDLDLGRLRAASPGTVWWAAGSTLRAIRTHDPTATEEARAAGTIVWLGYDETRRAIAWAAGSQVSRKPEDGGTATVVLRAGAPIRAALPSRTGRRVGLVAGDSLLLWDPVDDRVQRLGLSGLRPSALFETPGGGVLVATTTGRGAPPGLARADSTGSLTALGLPRVKGGVFIPVPGGTFLLLADPGPRPPASLQALDVATGRWTTVENPGIAGWELLEPR